MSVTLKSRLRQMQSFNLVHDAYCASGLCECSEISVVVLDENPRTGERAPRRLTKMAPAVLTLLALESRSALRDSILDVPDVRAAIEQRHVVIVEQTPVLPARSRSLRPEKED